LSRGGGRSQDSLFCPEVRKKRGKVKIRRREERGQFAKSKRGERGRETATKKPSNSSWGSKGN